MGAPRGNCNACKNKFSRLRKIVKSGKSGLYRRKQYGKYIVEAKASKMWIARDPYGSRGDLALASTYKKAMSKILHTQRQIKRRWPKSYKKF